MVFIKQQQRADRLYGADAPDTSGASVTLGVWIDSVKFKQVDVQSPLSVFSHSQIVPGSQ